MKTHNKLVHLKIKRHKCTECGGKFSTKSSLKKHVACVHRKEIVSKRHPCTYCDKVLKTKPAHEAHEAWHKGLVDLKCSTCGKEFVTKDALNIHSRTHRSDGWRCNECGLGFKNQDQRAQHKMVVHNGVTDWNTCKECGKEFTTHYSLARHMKNHRGEGFKCAFCGEMFPTVYAKTKHAQKMHRSKSKSQENSKSNVLVNPQPNVESESQEAITFIVTQDSMII